MSRGLNSHDVDKLAECLRGLPPVPVELAPAGNTTPALKLLDCVLSLERKYKEFVVPRLDSFSGKNPRINTLEDLRDFAMQFESPADFFSKELHYEDSRRATIFANVLGYLLKVVERCEGTSDMEKLSRWATSVLPRDYKAVGIAGFGLAGWQYLRMLFGADTCKPDVHTNEFVKECIGRRVSPLLVVELMESAAPRAGLSVREADRRVWRIKAAEKRKGGCR